MTRPTSDFAAILGALLDHGVEFIVVGGVGAVLHGAPVTTFDLDVVHRRTGENVVRILSALRALDARDRTTRDRARTPDASHLMSEGHQLLTTRHGPLDLLGAIGSGRTYEDLIDHAVEMPLGEGRAVKVLDLPTLIATKEEAGRDVDRAVLPILRRTLEEKARKA